LARLLEALPSPAPRVALVQRDLGPRAGRPYGVSPAVVTRAPRLGVGLGPEPTARASSATKPSGRAERRWELFCAAASAKGEVPPRRRRARPLLRAPDPATNEARFVRPRFVELDRLVASKRRGVVPRAARPRRSTKQREGVVRASGTWAPASPAQFTAPHRLVVPAELARGNTAPA